MLSRKWIEGGLTRAEDKGTSDESTVAVRAMVPWIRVMVVETMKGGCLHLHQNG